MRTVAVMLGLLIGSSAQGVQPFSWNLRFEIIKTVPSGMVWVVEQATGYGTSLGDFPRYEVGSDSGAGGLFVPALYLPPTVVLQTNSQTVHFGYNQPLTARFTGDLRRDFIGNGVTTAEVSLIGYLTPTLAGDYSGDGIVNAADYTVLRDNAALWEPSDLVLFQSNYGNGSAAAGSPVPEPSAAVLLILGAMGVGLPIRCSRS